MAIAPMAGASRFASMLPRSKGFNMFYIQRKDSNGLETVDEFTTRKEARAMLDEYQLSDWSAVYYISSRCCKAWKV
jgi:hypothetical protein